ncbi:MAG: energy-coupled thiamine transporter ThiT [Eubacteriales bacterium]|nr:energy-coupled thiamine transporter ThiT [Eubacteriales bacterium]
MSKSTKKLVYCAMCIALGVVLGLFKLFEFPFGGSVTLCRMLFIMLPGWLFGPVYGIICGLASGMLDFVLGPWFLTVPQFLFDYVFAFSIMGLGGLLKDQKNGLLKGYIVAIIGRWVMATISGLIWVSLGSTAWDGWSPLPYSMAYNAAYIFTEGAITIVILCIPAVKKALERIKQQANA